MSRVFRNIGISDYRRATGELVKSGETFEPTEKELSWLEPGMGIRFEEVFDTVNRPVAVPDEEEEEDAGGESPAEWPLKMPPVEYLERYPNGPKAELARSVLAGAR